ncbi:MAG: hypothetical protein HYW23_02565 [Candidatus Aenigmarchaeota archaeon]|nr:hypothetical protein [Candidatus Aenigmarchaeota archaeon]
MEERETRITRHIRKILGDGYFVTETPLGRAEHVYIQKKGEFFRHPPQQPLDILIKEIFPDVSYNLKVFPDGFFDTSSPEKDELVLTFGYPSNYTGHFVVFGNDNHVMLGLVRRGRYPTRIQSKRYVDLVTRIFSGFYQK